MEVLHIESSLHVELGRRHDCEEHRSQVNHRENSVAVAGCILDLKGVTADLKVEGRLVGWFDFIRRLNRLSLRQVSQAKCRAASIVELDAPAVLSI